MSEHDQPSGRDPHLSWRDGIPVSTRFDDPYFSLAGGLDETAHVFVQGNDLPARLRPGFAVAELGFGTGLNLLALAMVATVPVSFTSFEAFAMSRAEMARAHVAFPAVQELGQVLCQSWPEVAPTEGVVRFKLRHISAQIILGDARETLPRWSGRADAWFLDGFSPVKNPELWSPELMAEVARHTAPGGTFATYTAAGHVRRSLAEAGFDVSRQQGFGRKRHMSVGRLVSPARSTPHDG